MQDPAQKLLKGYSPEIQQLAESTRALIRKLAPGAEEKVHPGWKMIAYGFPKPGKKFCAIGPHAKWINLQFHSGGELPDSEGLLEGSGKSMRHVKVNSAADLKRKGLAALIRAAAEHAA